MNFTAQAIASLTRSSDRFRQAIAEHFGVDGSTISAMSELAAARQLSPRELATRLSLTPSSVTALLDRVERAGYASRHPHPTDRRQTVVTLTAAGTAIVTRYQTWVSNAVAEATTALTTAELAELVTLLTAIATRFNEYATSLSGSDEHRESLQAPDLPGCSSIRPASSVEVVAQHLRA